MKKLFYVLLTLLTVSVVFYVYVSKNTNLKQNIGFIDKNNIYDGGYKYGSGISSASNNDENNDQKSNAKRHDMAGKRNYNKCKQPPGWYIQYLLSNHSNFEYNLDINDENMTINWKITGDSSDLRLLAEHIECIGEVMESGEVPRKWDPIFILEAKVKQDNLVKTVVKYNNGENAVYVTKTTEDPCAYEVIKAHALVVKGFFETGRQESSKTHSLTDKIKTLCKRYL